MRRLVSIACFALLADPSFSFLASPALLRKVSCSHLRVAAPRNEKRSGRGTPRSTNQKGGRRPSKKDPEARPVLTNYDEQRNEFTNQQRLNGKIGCEHFGQCPGCVVDSNIGEVDIIKSAKLYFSSTAVRKRRMDVAYNDLVVEENDDGFYNVVVPSLLNGWRTQAKLAVAPKSSAWAKDGCAFGLYARGTHSVLPIPNCQVHHPSINKAVETLAEATAQVGTSPYEEDKQDGGLRYVQFQVERSTGKVCLTMVWNAEQIKQAQPGLSRLVKSLQSLDPDLWHSIWLHCNNNPGNAIFSRNPSGWHLISGPEFIREPLPVGDKGWLYFTPLAFRQGNMDGFDILATDVAKHVPGGSRVCELYAGIGVLGMTALAYHAEAGTPLTWVRCSDENPANPRCFQRTVDSMPSSVTGIQRGGSFKKEENLLTIAELMRQMESGQGKDVTAEREGDKTSYLVASAAKALTDGQALGANVLIVDPPRRGLEQEVLDELCKPFNSYQIYVESKTVLTIPDDKVNWVNDVTTLVYVSCGFDALARDCERLLSSQGGWLLESATGYVLFPGSNHVETVAVFRRKW